MTDRRSGGSVMTEHKNRDRKKWRNFLGIAGFLAVIGAAPALTFTLKDREFSENENRYLAQKPYVSLERIKTGEFMRDMEEYVSDQPLKALSWLWSDCREAEADRLHILPYPA